MSSSSSALRKASEIVTQYLKASPYYVEQCSIPLDIESRLHSPDFLIELNKGYVEKVENRIAETKLEIEYTMKNIKDSQESFFVKNIHRSRNWYHAYTLLEEFQKNILSSHTQIAKEHSNRIEKYANSPKKPYYPFLSSKAGDYHLDIQKALDFTKKDLSSIGENNSEKDFNYFVLLLIYSACYIAKKQHQVEMYSSEWNSFKRSVENWFIEITDTPKPKSSVETTPNGGTVLAENVASCWQDMQYFEDKIDGLYSIENKKYIVLISDIFKNYKGITIDLETDLLKDNLVKLIELSSKEILPKVMYAFCE